MALFKFVRKLWRWLNKHELVSGFFVIMLGVWAAFLLAGLGEQIALDRATEQRLHLVVLEAQYNCRIAKEIFRDYAEPPDPNTIRINIKRPNSIVVTTAFQETNLLAFLPLHKVSFLRSYVNIISTLNQSLQVHQGVLESQGYKKSIQEKQARRNVRDNAAAVYANVYVLQEELKEHFDPRFFDRKEAKRIEDRVRCIKEKVLKGEFPPFNEE